MSERRGKVVKETGGVFTVLSDGKTYVCFSPKKFRYNKADALFVGDDVLFSTLNGGKGLITKILPRKNMLSRPQVANVDVVFVVVAPLPEPDFLLVDKVLVNCFKNGILPVLTANKEDLADASFRAAVADYEKVCDCVFVSGKEGDTRSLQGYIVGNTVCFAGQSAVGKTSLLNALLPDIGGAVGGLSQKTQRGMHTTRHSRIYPAFGGYVVDTPGFSMVEIEGVDDGQLMLYYDDMAEFSVHCRYRMCTHTAEPDCAVRKATEEGKYSSARFERYKAIKAELAEAERNKY